MRYLKGVLFICSVIVSAIANAGHYDVTYSGGTVNATGWSGTTNSPDYGLSNGKWGGLTSSVVNPSNQASETAKTVDYSGQITATFTWVPDVPNEPTPTVVLLTQECTASWSGESGTISTGLPNEVVTPGLHSGSATAKKITAKSNPGGSFTVLCSPSANGACTPNGTVLAASAGVAYSASAALPEILLEGVTELSGNYYCLTGQVIRAKVNLADAGLSTFYLWTRPNSSFKNFTVSLDQTVGKAVNLPETDLVNSSISFAFREKQDLAIVKCDVEIVVDGQTIAVSLSQQIAVETMGVSRTISELSPSSTYFGEYMNGTGWKYGIDSGNIDLDDWSNHGGRAYFSGSPVAGIVYKVVSTGFSSKYSDQGNGYLQFVQLLTGSVDLENFPTPPPGLDVPEYHYSVDGWALDNQYPAKIYHFPAIGPLPDLAFNDSPSMNSGHASSYGDTSQSFSYQKDFELFAMFVPPSGGLGAYPVTLQKCEWNFHCSAARDTLGGELLPRKNPDGDLTLESDAASTEHPNWTSKFTNYNVSGGGDSNGPPTQN